MGTPPQRSNKLFSLNEKKKQQFQFHTTPHLPTLFTQRFFFYSEKKVYQIKRILGGEYKKFDVTTVIEIIEKIVSCFIFK